jgi:hypothetical protein
VTKDGEYLSWVECRKQQRNWVTGEKKNSQIYKTDFVYTLTLLHLPKQWRNIKLQVGRFFCQYLFNNGFYCSSLLNINPMGYTLNK